MIDKLTDWLIERRMKQLHIPVIDYNGFHISIEITNEPHDFVPVSVFVKKEEINDAVTVDFSIKDNQMKMKISDNEQTEHTKSRSLKEWKHLEKLEKSLKVIGDFFKR